MFPGQFSRIFAAYGHVDGPGMATVLNARMRNFVAGMELAAISGSMTR